MTTPIEMKVMFRTVSGVKFEKIISDITNIKIKDLLPEIREKLNMTDDTYIGFKFINSGKVYHEDSLLSDISLKAPITVFGQRKEFTSDTSSASSSSPPVSVTPPNSTEPSPRVPIEPPTPEEVQNVAIRTITGMLLLAIAQNRESIDAYIRNPIAFALNIMESRQVTEFIRLVLPQIEAMRLAMTNHTGSGTNFIPIPPLVLENVNINHLNMMIPVGGVPPMPQHPPNNFTPEDNENIDKLTGLGFSKEVAVLAYIRAGRDVNVAANVLFESAQFDNAEDH